MKKDVEQGIEPAVERGAEQAMEKDLRAAALEYHQYPCLLYTSDAADE